VIPRFTNRWPGKHIAQVLYHWRNGKNSGVGPSYTRKRVYEQVTCQTSSEKIIIPSATCWIFVGPYQTWLSPYSFCLGQFLTRGIGEARPWPCLHSHPLGDRSRYWVRVWLSFTFAAEDRRWVRGLDPFYFAWQGQCAVNQVNNMALGDIRPSDLQSRPGIGTLYLSNSLKLLLTK
jgi:hypothetical protein